MRFIGEAIDVNVHINAEGEVRPLSFTWRGQHYPISGIGRTYTQDGDRYFLVVTPGDRIFELRWHIPDNRWFIARAPASRMVA
jgi:hypothetical protein